MIIKKARLISFDHTTGGNTPGSELLRRKSSISEHGRRSSAFEAISIMGIFYMFLSSIFFCLLSFGTKLMYLGTNITPFEAIYFRGFSMVIFNIIYAYFIGLDILSVPSDLQVIMWIRTIIGTMGITFNFVANKILPISIANTLFFLYPLITSLGGYVLLGEKMSKLEMAGMFVSFVGVILVVRYSQQKTDDNEEIPFIYYIPPLLSSLTATGVYLLTRLMGKRVHFLVNPTWFGVVQSTLITPIWMGIRSSNESWDITTNGLFSLLLICIGGWLGQVFMNKSLQLEKAGRVAAIGYIQIPILFFCDVFYFKVEISWPVILGSILIILCSFIVSLLRMLNMIQ